MPPEHQLGKRVFCAQIEEFFVKVQSSVEQVAETHVESMQGRSEIVLPLQACPHGSVEFRLRPPGIDLWTSHTPSASELALQFMLLGAGMIDQPHTVLSQSRAV